MNIKTILSAHKGLPTWPAYTPDNGATMIFDTINQVKNNPDKELL